MASLASSRSSSSPALSLLRRGGQQALLLAFITCCPVAICAAQSAAPKLAIQALKSPAAADSGMPHLASTSDGELYLSWLEGLDGPRARLRFSRLGADGWGPASTIASGEDWFNNWADRPSIAGLGKGVLVAHWLQRLGAETYAYGVRFTLSRDAGAHWDRARWLHEDRQPVEHGFASFAALDEKNFGAVWLDGRATLADPASAPGFAKAPQRLYYRSIASDGSMGAEHCLDNSVCDCCPTTLAQLGAGQQALFYRNRTAGEVRNVQWILGAEGSWSDARELGQEPWTIAGCPVNGPSISADAEHFAAAWYSGAGEESHVLASFGNADGCDELIVVDEGAPEGRADVQLWNSELCFVSWMELVPGGAAWRLRSVARNGELGEPVDLAKVPGNRGSGYGRLARAGKRLIFAWTDSAQKRVRVVELKPAP